MNTTENVVSAKCAGGRRSVSTTRDAVIAKRAGKHQSVPLHSGTESVLWNLYHYIVVLNLYCSISTTMEWY